MLCLHIHMYICTSMYYTIKEPEYIRFTVICARATQFSHLCVTDRGRAHTRFACVRLYILIRFVGTLMTDQTEDILFNAHARGRYLCKTHHISLNSICGNGWWILCTQLLATARKRYGWNDPTTRIHTHIYIQIRAYNWLCERAESSAAAAGWTAF